MLEKITTSLEVSKELAELGVDGPAGVYHVCFHPRSVFEDFTEGLVSVHDIERPDIIPNSDIPIRISEELGYVLPYYIWSGKYIDGRFNCWNQNSEITHDDMNFFEKKESDARAKMLIWLIENDHITAEKVNERLREFWG